MRRMAKLISKETQAGKREQTGSVFEDCPPAVEPNSKDNSDRYRNSPVLGGEPKTGHVGQPEAESAIHS